MVRNEGSQQWCTVDLDRSSTKCEQPCTSSLTGHSEGALVEDSHWIKTPFFHSQKQADLLNGCNISISYCKNATMRDSCSCSGPVGLLHRSHPALQVTSAAANTLRGCYYLSLLTNITLLYHCCYQKREEEEEEEEEEEAWKRRNGSNGHCRCCACFLGKDRVEGVLVAFVHHPFDCHRYNQMIWQSR
jgi:hypothetical protein